jgi:hypothetical protein
MRACDIRFAQIVLSFRTVDWLLDRHRVGPHVALHGGKPGEGMLVIPLLY